MEYKELDALIEQLKEAVEDNDPQKGHWKELWALAKQIGSGFKETRYPTKSDKDDAWNRFQELREQASARSDEDRTRIEKQKQEWEGRQERSSQARSKVEGRAAQTRPLSGIEQAIGGIILAPILLVDAILRDILGLEQLDQVKEELLSCNAKMWEAWDLFSQHKNDLLPGDKSKTYETLFAAQERLNQAWADWKSRNNLLFEARREERKRKQREYEEKHQRFVERVEANISKLEGKLESAKAALDRQETHLDKLRDDYSNAWNDKFRERCSEWIEQGEEKISDIKEHIERLETWLEEERSKIK
jgi:hypothetical protein